MFNSKNSKGAASLPKLTTPDQGPGSKSGNGNQGTAQRSPTGPDMVPWGTGWKMGQMHKTNVPTATIQPTKLGVLAINIPIIIKWLLLVKTYTLCNLN